MEAEDTKVNPVVAALLRLKQFTDCITEAIGHRARKRIYGLANQGIENETRSREFLYLVATQILKEVRQSNYLTDKLIKFADYEVTVVLLFTSLGHEANGKKSFWRFGWPLFFRDEEKERLIDVFLAGKNDMRVFSDIRFLLCFAKTIPYQCQQRVYCEYMALIGKFTTAADFLSVYEMWVDLSPDLREDLRQMMGDILRRFSPRALASDEVEDIKAMESGGGRADPEHGSN